MKSAITSINASSEAFDSVAFLIVLVKPSNLSYSKEAKNSSADNSDDSDPSVLESIPFLIFSCTRLDSSFSRAKVQSSSASSCIIILLGVTESMRTSSIISSSVSAEESLKSINSSCAKPCIIVSNCSSIDSVASGTARGSYIVFTPTSIPSESPLVIVCMTVSDSSNSVAGSNPNKRVSSSLSSSEFGFALMIEH